MSLIKEALDKIENKKAPDAGAAETKVQDNPANNTSSDNFALVIWSILIVVIAAFIGGQLVLLAWLFILP